MEAVLTVAEDGTSQTMNLLMSSGVGCESMLIGGWAPEEVRPQKTEVVQRTHMHTQHLDYSFQRHKSKHFRESRNRSSKQPTHFEVCVWTRAPHISVSGLQEDHCRGGEVYRHFLLVD